MIILKTPTPNTKWKNIFPGNLILGSLDSPSNYKLVDISEYEAQMEVNSYGRKN